MEKPVLSRLVDRARTLRSSLTLLAGAGAIEVLKQVVSPAPDATTIAIALTPVLSVAGSLLPNVAANQVAQATDEEYAQRNHHLRLGMAEALRLALTRSRVELKIDSTDPTLASLFDHWDENLALVQDRSVLDQLMPGLLEEDLFDASSGTPGLEEGARALGSVLYNWVTTDLRHAVSWTPEQAFELGRKVLPRYFEAFKQAAINDDRSHLFQAFTVNGINRLLAALTQLPEQIRHEHEITRAHITSEIERASWRPESRGPIVPRDWRPPELFVGREDQIRTMQDVLVHNPPASVSVFSVQGLPGVGKSLLCEHFAASHRDLFPGGYARITLAPEASLSGDQLLLHLAGRFGIKGEGSQASSLLQMRLSHPRSLVHIENVDDDAAGLVAAQLARRLGGCALMISGRRVELGKGQGWTQVLVQPFEKEQALQQLVSEMGRQPQTTQECTDWELLLERCGYLPLAIHLSAGQLQFGLLVADILPELLTIEAADAADPLYEEKARSCLRTSFELSWKLFESHSAERERKCWGAMLCSFSAAPLSAVGAGLGAAVCGLELSEFKKMMGLAVGLSLVIREGREHQKWRQHTLIREFLASKLPEARDQGAARQSRWFLERLPSQSDIEVQNKCWDEIEAEEEALSAWLNGLDAEAAKQVVEVGYLFAPLRGPWRAWLRAAEEGLTESETSNGWNTTFAVASQLARFLGDVGASLRFAYAIRERATAEGNDQVAAQAAGQIYLRA